MNPVMKTTYLLFSVLWFLSNPLAAQDEGGEPDPFGADQGALGGKAVRKIVPGRPGQTGIVRETMWDVSLAPESVELAGILEWGVLGAKMPQFISFRSSTTLRVRDGEWALVGTQTPRNELGEKRPEEKRMVFLKVERAR